MRRFYSVFDEDYIEDPRYSCPYFNPYTGCECPADYDGPCPLDP